MLLVMKVFFKCDMNVCQNDSAQVKQYYDYERANDKPVIDYLEEHLDGFEDHTGEIKCG